ncbi:hypothetical protein N9Y17_01795 [Gammaproteobacteria bacterium]|nr:hypothetical protein [Gammaproteobacteria bacterium]
MKIVQKNYQNLCNDNTLLKSFSEIDDNEFEKQINKDFRRNCFIVQQNSVQDTKQFLLKNWQDGYTQGNLDSSTFSDTLISTLKGELALQDMDQTIYFDAKKIRFCYQSSDGRYHGISISLAYNHDDPTNPNFIVGHIENINGRFEQRQVTLLGQGIFFDNERLNSLNGDTSIKADQLTTTVPKQLQSTIQHDTVKQLLLSVFNGNRINLDAFKALQLRKEQAVPFQLDYQEEKKSLLENLRSIKANLPQINDLISQPAGDECWLDANFQATLDTYACALNEQEIQAAINQIDQINSHDNEAENRPRDHVKRQWIQAGLNSGSLQYDDSTLTNISDQKTNTLIQNHQTISEALTLLETALQADESKKIISPQSKMTYINTLLASDKTNFPQTLCSANQKLIQDNQLYHHRYLVLDYLKFTIGNLLILIWKGLKYLGTRCSQSPSTNQNDISFFSFKPRSNEVADTLSKATGSMDENNQITLAP